MEEEIQVEPLIHGYTVPTDPLLTSDIEPYPQESLPGNDEEALADPTRINSTNWPVYMFLYKKKGGDFRLITALLQASNY